MPPPEVLCEREKLIRVLKENLRTEEMTLVLLKKLQQSQQINQIAQNVTITPQAAHTKDHSNLLASQLPTGKSAQPPMPHVPHHVKPPPPPLNRLVSIKMIYILSNLVNHNLFYSRHHPDLMHINLTSQCLRTLS